MNARQRRAAMRYAESVRRAIQGLRETCCGATVAIRCGDCPHADRKVILLMPGTRGAPVAEYLAKVEADPRRAAALQRARERARADGVRATSSASAESVTARPAKAVPTPNGEPE